MTPPNLAHSRNFFKHVWYKILKKKRAKKKEKKKEIEDKE